MSYGTISRKSSGKGKSARLPIGLCILFFAVYFSFLFFFRYTQSTAFFQYLELLFGISILVSLVYSFFTRKAWISLGLQILFGLICIVNYHAYQSDMQEELSSMEKQLEELKKQAEDTEKAFKQESIDLIPGKTERIVLINIQLKPLLLTEKNWRSQVISLAELQFFNSLQDPEDEFMTGKPGWTGKNTIVTGCYFGLFYRISIPTSGTLKGMIKSDGSPKGNLICINNNILSSYNDLYRWNSFFTENMSTPGTKTIHFSMDLTLSNLKSTHTTIGSATWKFIPALAPVNKKKSLEFR